MIEKWKINEAAFKSSTSYSGNEFVEGVKWAEKEIFEDDDITNLFANIMMLMLRLCLCSIRLATKLSLKVLKIMNHSLI